MPYNLANLARRSRKWRVISPTSALASDLFAIAFRPVLTAWTQSAAAMLNLYPDALASGSVDALAREDEGAADDVAQIIAALLLWRYFHTVEGWHRRKWLSSVSNAAGVSVDMLLQRPSVDMPIAIPNRAERRAANAALVRTAKAAVRVAGGALVPSVGLTGVDAVLGNAVASNVALVRSVSDQARARIASAVFNGVTTGRSAEDVAREIRRGMAVSRKRALGIAKDQVLKATKALNRFRIQEAGWEEAQWNHLAGQKNPRHNHRAMDGKILPLNDTKWGWLNEPFCHCWQSPPPIPLVLGRGNRG